MKTNHGIRFLPGAALAMLLLAVPSAEVFAADTAEASYGYLTGQQQNAQRHAQYEAIAGFTTDRERAAYYEAQGIGGGAYSESQHLDAQALVSAGIITQETADQIAGYASEKHDGIHSRFEQMAGMTAEQRHELYGSFQDDGFSGDSIDELAGSGILTKEQADAINTYLSGGNG